MSATWMLELRGTLEGCVFRGARLGPKNARSSFRFSLTQFLCDRGLILFIVVAMFLEAALVRWNEKCEVFSSCVVVVDFWAHGGMYTAVRNLGIAEDIFVIKQKFWFVGPNAARQHAVLSRTPALKSNWTGNRVDWRSCHSLAPIVQKI